MTTTAGDIIKTIIELFLAGGLGGVVALVGQLIARRKTDAEARQIDAKTNAEVPADAATSLINAGGNVVAQYKELLAAYQETNEKRFEQVHEEQSELREILGKYAKRITYLMTGIQMLIEQLTTIGHEPCWTPNEWRTDFHNNSDSNSDPTKEG